MKRRNFITQTTLTGVGAVINFLQDLKIQKK